MMTSHNIDSFTTIRDLDLWVCSMSTQGRVHGLCVGGGGHNNDRAVKPLGVKAGAGGGGGEASRLHLSSYACSLSW